MRARFFAFNGVVLLGTAAIFFVHYSSQSKPCRDAAPSKNIKDITGKWNWVASTMTKVDEEITDCSGFIGQPLVMSKTNVTLKVTDSKFVSDKVRFDAYSDHPYLKGFRVLQKATDCNAYVGNYMVGGITNCEDMFFYTCGVNDTDDEITVFSRYTSITDKRLGDVFNAATALKLKLDKTKYKRIKRENCLV